MFAQVEDGVYKHEPFAGLERADLVVGAGVGGGGGRGRKAKRRLSVDSACFLSSLALVRSADDADDDGAGTALYAARRRAPSPAPAPAEPLPLRAALPALRRILALQLLASLAQTLAALSALVDLLAPRPARAFGAQHVALLLVAWGPVLVFGVPWGRGRGKGP